MADAAGDPDFLSGAQRRRMRAQFELRSVPAREGVFLPGIKLKENESFEGALKRFKKQCEKAGLMYELRRREYYEKPSVRRKKKALAARKRAIKKLRAQGPV